MPTFSFLFTHPLPTGSQSAAVHPPRARRVGGVAGGLRQRKGQGERRREEGERLPSSFPLPSTHHSPSPSLSQVPTTPYALTPLTGIKFSITGGRSAAKDALAAWLTAAGATYTTTLTKTCTHLLVLKDDPPAGTGAGTSAATRTVSAKERAAREWRQRVVWGEAWGGAVLGPRGYDRSVDADTAVPAATSASAAPAPAPASAVGTVASMQAPAARPVAAARVTPVAPPPPPPPPPPSILHITIAPGDPDAMFLDGARIALTSTRDAGERAALLSVVRAGGATFERFLHSSVTHAVVGSDPSPDEADALRAHAIAYPGATSIVGVSWLAACAAERRIVEAGPHTVDASTLARGAPLSGHHFTLAALAPGDGAADAASTIVRAGGRTFDGRTARGVPSEAAWAVCPPGLPATTAAALTASSPDFAMVPPTHRVTLAWLVASVAAGRPVAAPPPPRTLSAARGLPPAPPLTPLPHALPLPDFAGGRVVLCGSGLSAAARAAAAALGAVLGAKWKDAMTAATTHLLTRGRTGEKYARAGEYGVTPVTPDWLTACAVAGRRVEDGAFHPPESGGEPAARVAAAAAVPSPAPPAAAAATPSSVASRGGGGSGRGGRRMSGLELSAVARAAVGVPSPAVASAPPPPPRRTPVPDAGGTPLAVSAARAAGETPVAASSRVAAAAATPRALSAAAAATPVAAVHPPPPPPPPPSADRPELRAAFDALDAAIGSRAGGGGASRLGGGGRAATAAPAAAGSTPPSARTRRRLRTTVAPLPHDDSQNSDPAVAGGGDTAPPGRKRARRAAVAPSAPSLGVPSSLPPPPPDCSQLVAYDAGAGGPSPPLGGGDGAPPGRRRRDRGAPPSAEARRALVRAVTRRGAGSTDVLAEMGLM